MVKERGKVMATAKPAAEAHPIEKTEPRSATKQHKKHKRFYKPIL
jgi:hypothetical protein